MAGVNLERVRHALAPELAVQCEIGRGGMAVVFRAARAADGADVALKVLRPEIAAAIGPERFLREIAFLRQLDHPHILPLLASGEAGPLVYFVMPFATGESLRTRIDRHGPLSVADVFRVTREIAAALDYAHSRNVLHRDLKPENILEHRGRWTLCDFGVARAIALAGQDSLSPSGVAVGTPAYMSPEQAAGEDALDGRADIYALGCVVYEMLAGHPPFTGGTAHAVLARHARDVPPPLAPVRPDLPPAVQAATERALAKRPADRPATGAELVNQLFGAL